MVKWESGSDRRLERGGWRARISAGRSQPDMPNQAAESRGVGVGRDV
jgi:hypothetical protein